MKCELSQKEIEAIEKIVGKSGGAFAEVKRENGKIVVLQVDKKKIV